MGEEAIRLALARQSAAENWFLHGNGNAVLFDVSILVAGDCGHDAFAQPNLAGLSGLSLPSSRISFYYSAVDQVLNLSSGLNGLQRLGHDGPKDRTDQTAFRQFVATRPERSKSPTCSPLRRPGDR